MTEPKELGTLIVVVGKARNLPNKSRFGKQDPFCTLTINEEKQKTKAIKRGGQHPEWDEEFRFSIMEDVDDILTRSESQTDTSLSLSSSTSQAGGSLKDSQSGAVTPAALANKSRKGPIHKKGGKSMRVSCFADDAKEPELIGECVVDIEEALKKGEVDEWYEFLHKEKYSGEVYLELTFYSNDVPPVKRNVPRPTVHNYGGIGSYDPASSSSSSSINRNRLSGGLAASGSVSGMSLYIPPYAQPARVPSPAQTIVPSGSFADLGLPPGHARKQSLPIPMAGQPGYPVSSLSSHPTLNSMATLDSLTRPMSSLSIGTSYSSRPLPPASPAASEPPRNHQHSYGRHSVGGPGDAPWGSLLPQNQPPPTPAPHPRPVSSNDALQWQQVQRIEDERRRGGATPIPRPSSGQGYAPPNQSYPHQQPYLAPRASSPVPPSLMPAGPPQLPAHASSFSAATSSGYQPSYLSPSPAPTPPVHPASAPPESHYSTPSSSYPHMAQAPSEPFRAPSPRPGYQAQDAARPAYDVYGGDPNGYGAPPRSEAYPARQPSPQPYQPAYPSQSSTGQPYAQAGSQYPGYAPTVPTQDLSPPRGSTPTPGGYIPWYQQTASMKQPPANQPNGRDGYYQPVNGQPNAYGPPPPPVPSHRPVQHPPVPPKQSVGYYPSDELYALQRQQTPAPPQGQQQLEYQPPRSYTPTPPQPPPQSYTPAPQPPQTYTPAPQPPPHSYTPAPSQSYSSAPAHSYNPAPQHYPTAPFSPTNPPTSSMPFSQPPAQPSHSHSNSYSGRAPNGWQSAVPESYSRPSPDPARATSPVPPPPPPPKSSAPEGWHSTLPPPSQPLPNPNGRSPSPSPQVKTDWRSYMSNLPVNGRSPSPQPPNHQRQEDQREWYTPPPSLPASIRPPEGWRSTLPGQVAPNGHQWRG